MNDVLFSTLSTFSTVSTFSTFFNISNFVNIFNFVNISNLPGELIVHCKGRSRISPWLQWKTNQFYLNICQFALSLHLVVTCLDLKIRLRPSQLFATGEDSYHCLLGAGPRNNERRIWTQLHCQLSIFSMFWNRCKATIINWNIFRKNGFR